MRRALEDMLSLLLEQKQAQDELLGLSREKGRVIIRGDTERLNEIVSQERRLLKAFNTIDKRRETLTPAAAECLGVSDAELTVSVIIERAQPEERARFSAIQKELIGLVREQSELNESNQELIQAQLEYTDIMMELLVQSEDPLNNFYGDDGREQTDKRKTPGIFDTQV